MVAGAACTTVDARLAATSTWSVPNSFRTACFPVGVSTTEQPRPDTSSDSTGCLASKRTVQHNGWPSPTGTGSERSELTMEDDVERRVRGRSGGVPHLDAHLARRRTVVIDRSRMA